MLTKCDKTSIETDMNLERIKERVTQLELEQKELMQYQGAKNIHI